MGFTSEHHSKPLHFLKPADRVLQKEIASFLQHTPLPEFTFQFLKPSSESIVSTRAALWWERNSAYRAYQLILDSHWPAVLLNSRDPTKVYTARIPLLRQEVQKRGPIVLECLLDESDRILWVVDTLFLKGEQCTKTMKFVERVAIVQEVLATCIQPHAVLQSCEVRIAPWRQLSELASWEPTPHCCVEFAMADPGVRRFVWNGKTAQKKKDAPVCGIVDEEPPQQQPQAQEQVQQSQQPTVSLTKTHTIAFCQKDPKATGPDLYLLALADGTQLGSAAIRSMQIRTAIRKATAQGQPVLVKIAWYEPFQKYELKSIVESSLDTA